jgi:adenylate cyclase class 2
MAGIFCQLGYQPSFRYEKYRREYRHPGEPGVVTVDETPIGSFLELEGPGEWIDGTAKGLGFGASDYVLESYVRLYLRDCERRGATPAFMVFA